MDGVINVYKEAGYTSHDVVAKLRGILRQKKIGHTGTLDPDATGVLPVCLGKGTKLCDMLTDEKKTYEAQLLLGIETDTQDISGTMLAKKEVTVSEEAVRSVIESFLGDQMQVPPMYSALKVGGKKLYELAREGKTVERKARPVCFYEITILAIQLPEIRIRVTCSKGTYIRTLCHDIGQKLGCGGCMKELIRTRVGRFTRENSYTLSQIEEIRDKGELDRIIVPIDRMFDHCQAGVIEDSIRKPVYNGNRFLKRDLTNPQIEIEDGAQMRIYDRDSEFIGIYRYQQKDETFCLVKMFRDGGSKG